MDSKIKSDQLGIPFGTAQNRLRKMVLFDVLKRHNENVCHRCGSTIDTHDDLSIEHKESWLHNDPKLFWDLTNIAFSHCNCNYKQPKNRVKNLTHGTNTGYRYGCRCQECRDAHTKAMCDYRHENSR